MHSAASRSWSQSVGCSAVGSWREEQEVIQFAPPRPGDEFVGDGRVTGVAVERFGIDLVPLLVLDHLVADGDGDADRVPGLELSHLNCVAAAEGDRDLVDESRDEET